MEFPDLGSHCGYTTCNRLDFLPIKCDACSKLFCCDHINYELHTCPSSYKKNVQVPVCPLCNKPVPVNRDELPDFKVGQHIDNDCQSDPAMAKRKSLSHRCSVPRCKQKMFVPVECSSCRKNFCLKHRNVLDHDCKGYEKSGRSISNAALAAINRLKGAQSSGTQNAPSSSQSTTSNGVLTEDEALARAIHLSLNERSGDQKASDNDHFSQEEMDRRLAEALSRGDEAYAYELTRQNEAKKRCVVC